MTKLTKDQIDRGDSVVHRVTGIPIGFDREIWETLADILQRPWDLPSDSEWSSIKQYLGFGPGTASDSVSKSILIDFVRRRNANLLPKLVDPRREKIIEVLKQYPDRAPEIAEKIIAVFDEEQK